VLDRWHGRQTVVVLDLVECVVVRATEVVPRGFGSWPLSPSKDDDEAAEPAAVCAVSGGAHDGDDLLHLRWVGRVPQAFVARRPTREKSRHRRWRAATTGTVELQILT
jgi:hypothetical protein